MKINNTKRHRNGGMVDDMMSNNTVYVILGIVALAVGGYLLYEFVLKKYLFADGLSSLGSGGLSGGIPSIPVHEPMLRDEVDVNIGHGVGYGHAEYDIYKTAGIEDQKDKVTDWEIDEIEINKKTQAYQIPLLPASILGTKNLLNGETGVAAFERKMGIVNNAVHKTGSGYEPERLGGPMYGEKKSHLSNKYIWSKINKGTAINHGNDRKNPAIERLKQDTKDDKSVSADDKLHSVLESSQGVI